MRMRIIVIWVCGIFLITNFSSLSSGTKTLCVSESSELQDVDCWNTIEKIPLTFMIGFQILFGDFYTEDNVVLGIISSMIIWDLFSCPIPTFVHSTAPLYLPIYNDAPNLLYYKVRWSRDIVTFCYMSV